MMTRTEDFDLLLAEYELLREDERHFGATTLGLVTIILTVAGALGAVFVLADTRGEHIPIAVVILAPMLPLSVFALVASYGVSTLWRSEYIRDVESKLYAARGLRTREGWPVPAHAHATYQLLWKAQTGYLWKLINFSTLVVLGALIGLPIWTADSGWLQAILAVVYGDLTLFVVWIYLTAIWGNGKRFLGSVREAVDEQLSATQAEASPG